MPVAALNARRSQRCRSDFELPESEAESVTGSVVTLREGSDSLGSAFLVAAARP